MKNKIFQTILLSLSTFYTSAQKGSDFKPCGDGYYYPYYNNRVSYTPDFYLVKKHFLLNYKEKEYKDVPNNTGMVHIVFNVNCNGETGNYSLETFDFDYKYCTINDTIKSEFIKLTKELKIWQPIGEKEPIQNFHKYFIFKIKNGKLIEILLK